MLSVFDLFKIGIGPSSSHTVGPMRAARRFVQGLQAHGLLTATARVTIELFGSLAATGQGHGTDKAVLLGLEGAEPESVPPATITPRCAQIQAEQRLLLAGSQAIAFSPRRDLLFQRRQNLPHHPNGMRFTASAANGDALAVEQYYSVGGGFVVSEAEAQQGSPSVDAVELPYRFESAADLLAHADRSGLPLAALALANEIARAPEQIVRQRLLEIWRVMRACIACGIAAEGELPGSLHIPRRAAQLAATLARAGNDPLSTLDRVNLWAMAVGEENASGGRVVTAPTNGAAGIIPAVLNYYAETIAGADDDGIVRFLLVAGSIGMLYVRNASVSGAEVGCQGEVGAACSMAAGGLAEVLGGSPRQVENAAEIAMEHNLGLTCDPIAGLVQVPCIERNAMAAVKAINAARMALAGDGRHFVSLDKVIRVMRDTGADMKSKYKETARGGLAVNVIEC
ncbi:MAG: L-serine ammonia-lyase [Rhodocyclaceae bacterium]|nr:L-serine ammonia-lyase [Rhodocyclaceae bacterium]MBX3670071.1 L-serine ammonia-lyase [Rhodocyclaceae bacterium]